MEHQEERAKTSPVEQDSGYELANLKKQVVDLQEEIAASKSKIRLLLATIPVGLILIRTNGSIEVVNTVAQEMFGFSRLAIADQPVKTLFPHIERIDLQKPSFETEARHENGTTFPVEISYTEVSTSDGQRYFVFVKDVSERHRLEKVKQEFFNMISHDLRAPLMNISGVLELTASGRFGELSDSGQTQFANAGKSLSRLLRMLSDLLEIEKLSYGPMNLSLRLNNLTFSVQQAVDDVSALASEKDIEIRSWSENLNVQFDSDRVHRLLVNLLSNAIKFSPEKELIHLEYTKSTTRMEVRVIDHGTGIPAHMLEFVFDKYKQAQIDNRGVGLGLAICKAIVQAHGGSIGVCNNDPKPGSTFWFALPINENEI